MSVSEKSVTLDHAILGFLAMEPLSGYNLKKRFDQSVAHFWTATQSHIYKSLEKLESQGWAESQTVVQDGKPNTKVYSITGNGREELHRWLTAPLPLETIRMEWMVQVFFASYASDEEILALLETRLAEVNKLLSYYKEEIDPKLRSFSCQGLERPSRYWRMTLLTGIGMRESEAALLRQTIEHLRSEINEGK